MVGLDNKLKNVPVICMLESWMAPREKQPADRHRCGSLDYQDFHLSESVTNIGNNLNILCNTDNRELKQRRFGATYVNQTVRPFPINLPKRYQNCTAEFPFSYKEDLPKIWVKLLLKHAKSPLPVDMHI